MEKTLANVTIYDNGAAYMVMVDGVICHASNSLGDAWRHITWMYAIAQQVFTVGDKKIPVKEWIRNGERNGFLDTHYSESWH